MRAFIASVVCAQALLCACGKAQDQAIEEAQKEAAATQKDKTPAKAAEKKYPPVRNKAHVPCTQLIDPAAFKTALGEVEAVTVKDTTAADAEAAAQCSVMRGGKRPTTNQQQAMLKEKGRLGVMAGDEICNVTAYCWTIEDPDKFKAKCATKKDTDDDSMGSYACRQTVATGEYDVYVYRFFDPDTKCIIQVRGGASNTDNDLIRKCAVAARDTIGPAQIAVDASAPAPSPASGSGSGSGSGT